MSIYQFSLISGTKSSSKFILTRQPLYFIAIKILSNGTFFGKAGALFGRGCSVHVKMRNDKKSVARHIGITL